MPKRRGENHPAAKLTEADVRSMRRMREENNLKYEVIGLIFNVSSRTAYEACNRITWKEVT